MARRRRLSRPLLLTLGALAVIGVAAGGYKTFGHAERQVTRVDPAGSPVNAPVNAPVDGPTTDTPAVTIVAPKPPAPSSFDAPSTQPAGKRIARTPLVMMDVPTTRPALALVAARPAPTVAVDAESLFKDADAKIAADDLLAARTLLVDALDTKKFSPTEQDAAFDRLGKIADVVDFSPRKFISDPGQLAHAVKAGDNLQKIANLYDVTYKFIGRVNGISDPRKVRLGASLKIVKGPFFAVVNKTAFTLDLYQGDPAAVGAVFLKRLRVGLGEHDSTPSGLWKITTKLENPTYYNSRDTGPRVIPANDPSNPLGERWLALEGLQGQAVGKESYGIHGTIDPASIGQKKSMGCIRLLNEDISLVYDMLIKDKSLVTVVE